MTEVVYTLSNGTTVKTLAQAEASGLKYTASYKAAEKPAPKVVPAVLKGLV